MQAVPVASVGAVSGTGLEGMRLSHIVRYLEPGLGLPDVTVFTPDVLTKGDEGILLIGVLRVGLVGATGGSLWEGSSWEGKRKKESCANQENSP